MAKLVARLVENPCSLDDRRLEAAVGSTMDEEDSQAVDSRKQHMDNDMMDEPCSAEEGIQHTAGQDVAHIGEVAGGSFFQQSQPLPVHFLAA